MTIRDWLKKPVRTHTYGIQENRPRLYCNDGWIYIYRSCPACGFYISKGIRNL